MWTKNKKFIPVFQKLDPAIGLKIDIINEDGYEDPYVVDEILTSVLTNGMKNKIKRMSHL